MGSRIGILLVSMLVLMSACTKKNKVNFDEKTLHLVVPSKIKGFDPIYANDRYSSNELGRVYEGLLEFHYLKRPYTLVPNLAASMPKVSEDGLTYTFNIKEGVHFQDNACFKEGKGKELTAKDFVYSIKRLADPKLQSYGWWVIDGKIAGLNEWRDKNSGAEKVDYSQTIDGLKSVGKYGIQFKLTKPFPQFLYSLAMPFTFVVAKECVDFYGKEFLNNPVGTGPFQTTKFVQGTKIIYTKNPTFRKKTFPSDASDEFKSHLVDAGKPLPLVDKVIVNLMTEESTRWLSFNKGKVDYLSIPKDNFETAVTPTDGITPELKRKGINLTIVPSLDVTYIAFNHHYKLFRDNVDLRRALAMAYDTERANELFHNGKAMPAQSVVPPGIAGHIEDYKNPYKEYNIEKAKKLLAKAGYPEGKGLPEIVYDTSNATSSRQGAEFLKKSMAEIGVKIKINTHPFPELQKRIHSKKSMMYGIAWGADYPDAENFLQLLYGPNKTPGANGSNYDNDTYNELFAKASVMQDGPVRTALYEKLNRMAAEQVPWIFGVHRRAFVLFQSWVKNYVYSDFDTGNAQYFNVDLKKKQEMLKNF